MVEDGDNRCKWVTTYKRDVTVLRSTTLNNDVVVNSDTNDSQKIKVKLCLVGA